MFAGFSGARLAHLTPIALFATIGGIMRVAARNWWRHVSAGTLIVAVGFAGCISSDSGLGQAAKDCPEFKAGAHFDSSLAVDNTVRIFMQGSADLLAIGDK